MRREVARQLQRQPTGLLRRVEPKRVPRFCEALLALARAAKGNDRDRFTQAPRLAPLRRLDETLAARKPKLTWKPETPRIAAE